MSHPLHNRSFLKELDFTAEEWSSLLELAAQLPRQIAIRDGRIVGDSSLKEIVHDDVYAPA